MKVYVKTEIVFFTTFTEDSTMDKPVASFRAELYGFSLWFERHRILIWGISAMIMLCGIIFGPDFVIESLFPQRKLDTYFYVNMLLWCLLLCTCYGIGVLSMHFISMHIEDKVDWKLPYLRFQIANISWQYPAHRMSAREAVNLGIEGMESYLFSTREIIRDTHAVR
jgi:hypothetical protein